MRLSLSGYAGNSFSNTLSANRTGADRYKDVKGTVMIGAFDFLYDAHNWIVRGNFDYGHLTNSDKISQFNRDMPNASPSPKQYVGSDAIATGVEAGYDIFSQIRKLKERGHRFYVFGRYEFYDSMFDTAKSVIRQDWCGRPAGSRRVQLLPDQEHCHQGRVRHRACSGRTTTPTPPPGRPARGVSTTSPPFRWGSPIPAFSDS